MSTSFEQSERRQTLDDILEIQFSGDLEKAHDLYVEYFEKAEIRLSELNLFAICCVQLGKYKKAAELFEVVINHDPNMVEAFIHLSELKAKQGDLEGALEVLDRDAIETKKDKLLHVQKAKTLLSLDYFSRARESIEIAYDADPQCPETLLLYAQIERALKNESRSMALIRKLIFFHPENADALQLQAHWHLKHGNFDAALADARAITDQNPYHFNALLVQFRALREIGASEQMVSVAKKLFRTDPSAPEALEALCFAYAKNGEPEALINVADRALNIRPDLTNVSIMQSAAYFNMGWMQEALNILLKALEFEPNSIDLLQNLGVAQERLLDIKGAKATYEKMLSIDPSREATKFNLSLCELLQGNFHKGFELYESRFNKATNLIKFYLGDEPLWDGSESLEGKHLLVHPEQGYGDTIMACRFLNFLEGTGAKVSFAVPAPLKSLMETFETSAKLLVVGDNVGRIDYHCPLMSLPHLTSHLWRTLPSTDSYLRVPAAANAKWKDQFIDNGNIRVGFVCSGNPNHANDFNRSLLMSEFLKALPVGAEYHLLQKELRDTDEAALLRHPNVFRYDNEIEDFSDTAAICSHMDLIVSVDTSVAHLAGSLGIKTLLMAPLWPEWRWGLERGKSNWYPNTQIVRQLEAGKWAPVLEYISIAIAREIRSRQRAAA